MCLEKVETGGVFINILAIAWPPEEMSSVWQRPRNSRHVYDFRSSSWYIGAATSPKDIIILVDSSGSMTGQRGELARATISAILDTLGDNDFVNIFKFSDSTEELVPCFRDMLVQVLELHLEPLIYLIPFYTSYRLRLRL